jgi:putative acetyltransferase
MMDSAAPFSIRPFCKADGPALLALFRETVRRVNSSDYDAEQVHAWASDEIDAAAWTARFAGRFAAVAERDGVPVGFTELEDDGHIDRFFVAADQQRCGVGRRLMTAILDEARRRGIARLHADVSITARPFFAAQGFVELARQTVVSRGVEFVNYQMERVLGSA